jgi:cytochrome c5
MARPIIKSVFFIVLVIFFTGCYYDNKTELYPQHCDTIKVSFAAFIKPMVDRDCKACHSGTIPVGVIPLNDYKEIKSAAQTGKLYGSINGFNGYKPMPQGGTKWSDCEIIKLKSWIDAGTPNN